MTSQYEVLALSDFCTLLPAKNDSFRRGRQLMPKVRTTLTTNAIITGVVFHFTILSDIRKPHLLVIHYCTKHAHQQDERNTKYDNNRAKLES